MSKKIDDVIFKLAESLLIRAKLNDESAKELNDSSYIEGYHEGCSSTYYEIAKELIPWQEYIRLCKELGMSEFKE